MISEERLKEIQHSANVNHGFNDNTIKELLTEIRALRKVAEAADTLMRGMSDES